MIWMKPDHNPLPHEQNTKLESMEMGSRHVLRASSPPHPYSQLYTTIYSYMRPYEGPSLAAELPTDDLANGDAMADIQKSIWPWQASVIYGFLA